MVLVFPLFLVVDSAKTHWEYSVGMEDAIFILILVLLFLLVLLNIQSVVTELASNQQIYVLVMRA
jgi:hypothetical protein